MKACAIAIQAVCVSRDRAVRGTVARTAWIGGRFRRPTPSFHAESFLNAAGFVAPGPSAKTPIPSIDQTNPDNRKGYSVIGLRMICVYVKFPYLGI
ncbi:hypothetical protein F3J14_21105 [Burkholderia sp. Tr-862]|uniref:hypothetical protein n=1 Tax=Burkholderia sp. Tr-862 TaxID=2608331 RepID=UPI0014198AB2|nr:hypothetical protein [Burkholderia sp. Tr-862]NIF43343.1 hypothetical protein [Burkholderia sp. Tr-862]